MANLAVTITESLTLNSTEQGGTTSKTITGINHMFKRIVTVAANNDTTIASFHSDQHDDDGTIDVEQVKYVRITNLDSSNDVVISLQIDSGEDDSAADESASILLGAGHSFIMTSVDDAIAVHDGDASVVTALHPLESILIDSLTNTVQLELFIATT